MPRDPNELFLYPNLDFEYELAARGEYRQVPQLAELCRCWGSVLRVLPGCREAQADRSEGSRVVPWGVTPTVAEMTGPGDFPSPDVVKRVNDKRFSHNLERALGCALDGACIVGDLDELDAAVSNCGTDWVLKHPLGVGGRERVTGKGGRGYEAARRWAQARFQEGWTLVFEPWVYQRTEFSFHYELGGEGRIEYLGHCHLVSDESGAFRGNRVIPGQAPHPDFLTVTGQAVDRIATEGYWGPVSFDAFQGSWGERRVHRPVVEINARYTFGRLALELAKLVPAGWSVFWWHPKARERASVETRASEFPEGGIVTSGLYRLPTFADPNGLTGSFLVTAPTEEELKQVAEGGVSQP